MNSEAILNAQSFELTALDDSELDMVCGGRGNRRGNQGFFGGAGGGGGGGVNIDLDVNLNVAVIAGNIVLSDGGVSFSINQS